MHDEGPLAPFMYAGLRGREAFFIPFFATRTADLLAWRIPWVRSNPGYYFSIRVIISLAYYSFRVSAQVCFYGDLPTDPMHFHAAGTQNATTITRLSF